MGRPFPSRGLPGRRARPPSGGPGPRGHRAASETANTKATRVPSFGQSAAAGACSAAHAPAACSFFSAAVNSKSRTVESKFYYGRRMHFSRTYDDFFRLCHWAAIGGRQRGKRLGNIFGNGAVDALATPMSSPKNSLARGGVRHPATTCSRNFDRFLERIRVESAWFNHRGGREAA